MLSRWRLRRLLRGEMRRGWPPVLSVRVLPLLLLLLLPLLRLRTPGGRVAATRLLIVRIGRRGGSVRRAEWRPHAIRNLGVHRQHSPRQVERPLSRTRTCSGSPPRESRSAARSAARSARATGRVDAVESSDVSWVRLCWARREGVGWIC